MFGREYYAASIGIAPPMNALDVTNVFAHNKYHMTNEEIIADFKQFITATVSQQTTQLEGRMDGLEQRIDDVEQRLTKRIDSLEQRVGTLDTKLDTVQQAIADTLTDAIDAVDTRQEVEDLDHRVQRLERHTA
jgi:hypothetical protein